MERLAHNPVAKEVSLSRRLRPLRGRKRLSADCRSAPSMIVVLYDNTHPRIHFRFESQVRPVDDCCCVSIYALLLRSSTHKYTFASRSCMVILFRSVHVHVHDYRSITSSIYHGRTYYCCARTSSIRRSGRSGVIFHCSLLGT